MKTPQPAESSLLKNSYYYIKKIKTFVSGNYVYTLSTNIHSYYHNISLSGHTGIISIFANDSLSVNL